MTRTTITFVSLFQEWKKIELNFLQNFFELEIVTKFEYYRK